MLTFYKGHANAMSKLILKMVSSDETFLNRAAKQEKEKIPFFIKSKYKVVSNDYKKFEFHTINQKSKNNKHILYFHGGALCLNGSISHWMMIDKWVKKTDAKASYLIYPMIPEYKTDKIYEIAFDMYRRIVKLYPEDEMILIGESAGALIILSIMQLINLKEAKKPKLIVLISPWLDITLSNYDIKDFVEDDKILSVERFKGIEAYETKDSKVVPPIAYLYSEKITIYAGTHDILYPDMHLFESINPNIDMHVFQGCPHVFPLLPMKQSSIVHESIIKHIENL